MKQEFILANSGRSLPICFCLVTSEYIPGGFATDICRNFTVFSCRIGHIFVWTVFFVYHSQSQTAFQVALLFVKDLSGAEMVLEYIKLINSAII
jgi:hypothetical protein